MAFSSERKISKENDFLPVLRNIALWLEKRKFKAQSKETMFKVKNIILSLALLGCSGLAQAQQVEQRIDSLQILIGQQTVLHLKASVKQGDKVELPSFKSQQQITPGVEVVEQSKGDTSHIGDDRMVVSRDYTLTSFDEKVYVIPALNVKVNGKNFHGNQLALKVLTVPVDTVHPNQFYPPKDVQDNPFSWSEWSAIAVNPLWRMALSAQQTEKQQADYHPYPHRKTCSGS